MKFFYNTHLILRLDFIYFEFTLSSPITELDSLYLIKLNVTDYR